MKCSKWSNCFIRTFTLLISFKLICVNADDNVCQDSFETYYKNNERRLKETHHALYLITSPDPDHQLLTANFSVIAQKLGFDVKVIEEFCTDGLSATQAVAKKFNNVINLKVKVSQDYDNPELPPAGFIGTALRDDSDYINVCNNKGRVIKTKNHLKNYINGTIYSCKRTKKQNLEEIEVKLATKSIEKYSLLYQILINFSKNFRIEDQYFWRKIGTQSDPFEENGVLVCTNIKKEDYVFYWFNVVTSFVKKCQSVEMYREHNILAAVVDNPLPKEEQTRVPVIFYNLPYLLPEHKSLYPNGLALYNNSFESLSQGLISLLVARKWLRVAIVSDNSPYSEDFERRMIELFKKHQLLYAALSCQTDECDFTQNIRYLKENKATLIIANVEEYKNGVNLLKAVKSKKFHSATWIWRDWPFKYDLDLKVLRHVFSITVRRDLDTHRHPHIKDNIVDAIQVIDTLVNNHEQSLRSPSIVTSEIEKMLNNRPVRVNLWNIKTQDLVYSVRVHNNVVDPEPITNKNVKYHDPEEECMYRSNHFEKSCEDSYLLVIIIIIFLLLIISIIMFIFKQKYADHPFSYKPFGNRRNR